MNNFPGRLPSWFYPNRLVLYLGLASLLWLGHPFTAGEAAGALAEVAVEGIQVLGPGGQAVEFADLNGDGWQDVLLSRDDKTYLRLNDGSGQFGPEGAALPGAVLFLKDVELDGDYDLVVNRHGNGGEGVAALLNDSQGGFFTGESLDCQDPRVQCLLEAETLSAWPGDLDGDGIDDLVVRLPDALRFYFGPSGLVYQWDGGLPVSGPFQLGDMDLDGDLDLAVLHNQDVPFSDNEELVVTVFYNDGQGGFEAADSAQAYCEEFIDAPPGGLALGDLDGDGDLDILFTNNQAQWYQPSGSRLLRNQGGRSFTTTNLTSGNAPGLVLADLDKDGDLDAVLAGQPVSNGMGGTNTVADQVLYNDGDGNFSATRALESGWTKTPQAIVGDPDRDGDLDIVLLHTTQAILYISPSSPGAWYGGNIFNVATTGAAAGDLDGDGDLDLVQVRDQLPMQIFNGPAYVFFNDGLGQFPEQRPYFGSDDSILFGARGLALGDADQDGDLDLAAAPDGTLRLFLNDGAGNLTPSDPPLLSGAGPRQAAFADLDGDGDLDLAVESGWYRNQGVGGFTPQPYPFSAQGFAPGDLDGDGDTDLATYQNSYTYGGGQVYAFLNNGNGVFSAQSIFTAPYVHGLECGDLNGDGRLDIGLIATGYPNYVLLQQETGFQATVFGPGNDRAVDLAIGDLDNDGDLDLVVGSNAEDSLAYYNDGQGGFSDQATWLPGPYDMKMLGLGDLDGDGDLDALTANIGNWLTTGGLKTRHNQGYGNVPGAPRVLVDLPGAVKPAAFLSSGEIQSSPVISLPFTLSSSDPASPGSAAISAVMAEYSLNGGGSWHVAQPATPLSNLASQLRATSTGSSLALDPGGAETASELILRLSTPPIQANRLVGTLSAPWPPGSRTEITLFDGDGTLSRGYSGLLLHDRAADPIQNTVGPLEEVTVQPDIEADGLPVYPGVQSSPILITTIDLPDLYVADLNISVTGVYTGFMRTYVYLQGPAYVGSEFVGQVTCTGGGAFSFILDDESLNDSGVLSTCLPLGLSFDWQNQLRQAENKLASGDWKLQFYADGSTAMRVDQVQWQFTTYATLGPINGVYRPRQALEAFRGMPLDLPFTLQITDTVTGEPVLPLSWSLANNGVHYIFPWDTFASGFFGATDNLVFRISAIPDRPLPFPSYAASNFPFRARGTQVRVVHADGSPAANALVYRLPGGQAEGAQPLADPSQNPYRTGAQGFLPGRGLLAQGDSLFALEPISTTARYTLYATNLLPHQDSLSGYVVENPGVQEITVFPDHPLLAFNLEISLEWDARNDGAFMNDLADSLRQASQVLFDVSDGQAALGEVRIFHNRQNWLASDVILYAQTGIRPRASMGGLVDQLTDDLYKDGRTIQNAYGPGQIRIGPNWDPFGLSLTELTVDWEQAFAHELSHYLLYLPDNYLGVDPDGQPLSTDCRGSFMTSTYDSEYSEFLIRPAWTGDCLQTIAEHTTGRVDWETLLRFYPMLRPPADLLHANPGPALQPLALTRVQEVLPTAPANTLPPRVFDVRDSVSGVLTPAPRSQVFLFQLNGTVNDLTDDQVIPLGTTVGSLDRVKARGAAQGDRLCLFGPPDPQGAALTGCLESLGPLSVSIPVSRVSDWQPVLEMQAVTSTTLQITATLSTPYAALNVQFFPAYGAPGEIAESVWTPMTTADGLVHTASLTLAGPTFEGWLRLWAPGSTPPREAMSQIFLSPPWGPNSERFGGGANTRAWGANTRQLGAPVASGDGQVSIFNFQDIFAETGATSLQALNTLPHLPSWLTPVGQGYRFNTSQDYPRAISFEYLQREVPPGYEYTLTVYYTPDEGAAWQRLATRLDTDANRASAVMPVNDQHSRGIYALIATVELPPLEQGWNLFSFPIPETRSLPAALGSIDGKYTSVYYSASDGWKLYDATVPRDHPEFAGLVNDLASLEFARSYWLYATEPVIPYVGVPDQQSSLLAPNLTLPPAAYYGWVQPWRDFQPQPGDLVRAWIDRKLCGESVVQELAGQLAYRLLVSANRGDGCGAPGKEIRFEVGSYPLPWNSQLWDNPQAHYLVLGPPGMAVYFPVIANGWRP